MTFKKAIGQVHLWLGLASGIIVFIVSITGCIYVFQEEIRDMTESWRFVEEQPKSYLVPSQLIAIAEKKLEGKKATSLTYTKPNEAAVVGQFDRKKRGSKFTSVYINPYTGEVLKVKSIARGGNDGDFDFFRFILNGHRALWMPYDIGRPVVGVAVLIFVILLISGMILWWPKKWNKANRDKSFKVKWDGTFKRMNYDLHNVWGFYSTFFLLIISLTGLVYSFQWFSKGLYWVTTGGRNLSFERNTALSDTTQNLPVTITSVDKVWLNLTDQGKAQKAMFVNLPQTPKDAISVTVYLKPGTYYKTDVYTYDQFTLKPLKATGPFSGKYEDADGGDKLRRMNYDLHVGAVMGLPTKILAFLASLISASLPVTGFLIWWGRRKKGGKKEEGNKPVQRRTAVDSPRRSAPVVRRKVAQPLAVTDEVTVIKPEVE
ncbi:PepSY domain-containing protein [Siphonobacter sp. SORGH_AS_1065]|uniref:PepSY-associated TM helix domain-containing protein n=1 Tax=Siphonobacter sp. SORGH_AS_1065 TaxID=3041795 RepID=UPI0027878396|nr:PepSY-associated TM helix domain-containing protein [Siphonobacter sp. SORGH_AS_1065]MDQ1087356.1 putative iron-regulated membrane protein [Siphonobacter sp. SORGH_AS_1065]